MKSVTVAKFSNFTQLNKAKDLVVLNIIVITSVWILDTLLMSSNDLDCLEAPFSKEVDAVVEMYPQINLQIISVQTS